MGAPWRDHPSWELVREASEMIGRDVGHLLLSAGAEELTATRNSQIATFVLSLVALDAVERIGVAPARAAGHSLGEYTALVAAGSLSFEEGVRLVCERGDAMQAAAEVSEGTMAAVLGLDDDQVSVACVATGGDVWVANYNAPGQVVIAGSPDDVSRACDAAKRLGAKKALPLPVGGAFHTPYMEPARERLEKALDDVDLRPPDVPVVANVDGAPHLGAEEWPDLLATQLTAPVQWRRSIHHLRDEGSPVFVEIGPGKVLTALTRRIAPEATALRVSGPSHLDALLEGLAQPAASGRGDEGEGLFISERLVVAPSAGVFRPTPGVTAGSRLTPGDLLGTVNDEEVRSPFPGELEGILAVDGERVVTSQPLAWLRTDS